MSEPTEQTLAAALEGLGARIRVHEIARRTGLTSKDVLALLRENGVELPSAQSSVDADVATATITGILAPAAPAAVEPEPVVEGSLFQEPAAPAPKRSRARKPKAAAEVVEPVLPEADPVAAEAVEAVLAVEAPAKAPRTRTRKPKAVPVVETEPVVGEVAPAVDAVEVDAHAEPAPTRTRARRSRRAPIEEVVETEVVDTEVEAAVVDSDPTAGDGVVTIGAGDDNADWAPLEAAQDETQDDSPAGRRRRGRGSRRGRGRSEQGTEDQNDQSADVSDEAAPGTGTELLFVAPTDAEPVDREQDESDAADGDDDADGQAARRRRRRGRRGRGRVSDTEDGDDSTESGRQEARSDDEGESGQDGEADSTDGDAADSEDGESESGNRRRRRRRRRGGSGPEEGRTDDPDNTVVHVRETRPAQSSSSEEVQGVRGSTRLEAKRQRRRDTRESRKRPQILSEAEFLARREAVDRVMAVRQRGDLAQVALLEDGVLVEHFVSRDGAESLMGNIYLGRVQNVLPSMEAAFVDIGRGRNAVLYAGEVNWSAAGLAGKARRIETALSSGDTVLVQVSKDPVGHKGARLTTQISLPGRFLVYVPGGGATGISRKLPDTERKRLKAILDRIVPSDAGVIIRTAAEGVPEEELAGDVERLKSAWEDIQRRSEQKQSAPVQLSAEPDTLIKVVRDLFNSDIDKLVLDGPDVQDKVADYVAAVAPELSERVEKFDASSGHDVFHRYRIDEQISKALARKVHLPSGGSLVIDRTEAMTVVDVNTGKYTGSGGNLEETVTRNNLEAAEEIVRQLRLRDIGGIIVVDFIDMVLESNRELVLRRLTEALGRDRSRHQVAEVTSLGLVQMTRKRMGTGLVEAFSEPCSHCGGRGLVLHDVPVDGSGPDEDNGNRRRRKGNDRPQAKPEPLVETPRVVVPTTRKPDPRGPKPPTPVSANGSEPTTDPAPGTTSDAAAEAAAAVALLVEASEPVAPEPERAGSSGTDDVSAVLAALDALPTSEPAPRRRGRRAAGRAAGPAGVAVPIVLPEVSAALDAVIERIEPAQAATVATPDVEVEVVPATVTPDDGAAAENGDASGAAEPVARPRRRRAARRPAGPAQG